VVVGSVFCVTNSWPYPSTENGVSMMEEDLDCLVCVLIRERGKIMFALALGLIKCLFIQ